ncbi:histidine phosphatase family protein [Flaviflagellibacter deserti]|uniref:Histidine phosphatase family protein n=1 Tax=Flaviflagellibacter deserti TaxID=2267266 RepID=A0ABV9YWL3_9HYPH
MPLDYPLCIVRHGETDWNLEGRLQGQQDVRMNGRGRDQAEAVGRLLLQHAPEVLGWDFVASPLIRTRDTMELMRAAMGVDPKDYRLDPRLKELTFGSWECSTWDDVKRSFPDLAAKRKADKWAFCPPGGESYSMLSDRIADWLVDVKKPTLAVTHGGVARVLLGLLTGMAQVDLPVEDIKQGRALMFEDGKARWI